MLIRKIYVLCGSLCLIASPAQGQDVENLSALEQQLQDFLGKPQGVTGGARYGIDRRLKLKKCLAAPVFEKRDESLALIRCEPLDWRISVPLADEVNPGHRTGSERMVKRGQPVLLVVEKHGFMISRLMQADRSGGLGDLIPVRAARRARPILAEVTGEGRVALPSY
ncbi:flagella basal body P-ring formation protein FlgA [Parasphingorhabdus sp. JC815]|uniref:flagella basal body P-ring formation protein FlgA n=1 Tax=Parasphingorhabdus sp. JC815 TaxID=3232140 RepID=UPI0034598867